MRVRGDRECTECGRRWSYYDTGSVECPACGSLRSVGVDERRLHTDSPVDLELSPARERLASDDLRQVAGDAAERAREYVRARGFVRGGDLLDLDDRYLAAAELAAVGADLRRASAVDDDERGYLLALLRADLDDGDEGAGGDGRDSAPTVDGVRPAPAAVPDRLRAARGLAYATAVRDYRRELRDWLDDHDRTHQSLRSALDRLDGHVARVRALEGDVDPAVAERLVAAVRDLARAVRGDETALVTAGERLDALDGL
jgi:uncharacterized Zn finger protein (UPF0148 family)